MSLPDQINTPHINGYDFGIGVNYATGGPKNLAAIGAISTVQGAGGDAVRFRVQRVHTTRDIEQLLEINVEGGYGVPAFSASARFDFARSAKVQSSSLIMTVFAKVERAFRQIDDVDLSEEAVAVADQPTLFENRFGNMFVRGIVTGGLFIGYFRIDTGSAELSDRISAELSGSYGLFSAEADAKFEKVQRDFQRDLTIDMYHEGGPVDLQLSSINEPLELIRNVNLFLSSFQERPDEVARPYSVTIAPLAIANGPAPLNEIDLQHAQDVLVFCARRRTNMVDRLNVFQHIVDRPDKFDFSNGADLSELRSAAEALQFDLELIARCASRAMNKPGEAAFPDVFAKAEGTAFPQAFEPDVLPTPKPIQVLAPNAMPNFIGRPVVAIVSLLSCIQGEGVDHCLAFLGGQVTPLGDEARPFAEFFFTVLRSGGKFELHGDPNLPGGVTSQFPDEGVEVPPGATFVLNFPGEDFFS